MNIEKVFSQKLSMVYATAIMNIKGKTHFLAATEGEGKCLAFEEGNYNTTVIWDSSGGTMNIVPIPKRDNEFIAIQKFFPVFKAEESQIVYAKYKNGLWTVKPIMTIPYLHRFDIFLIEDQLHFIGATLCTHKDNTDDWSHPGKVYTGRLSEDITASFKLTPIIEGITKNHGFCSGIWKGKRAYFITGSEGVFIAYIPENKSGKWEIQQLFTHQVSDIALCDIDGDGKMEIAAIEPFHGNKAVIYKNINGNWKSIYEYNLEFGHVVWGGDILSIPSFIIGARRGKKELICLQVDKNVQQIKPFIIDINKGPSNVSVLNKGTEDFILAANRESDEAAIYKITK